MFPLHAHLPGVDEDRIRRLRRVEYDRLVAAGAFGDERVELIRGVIVRMGPHGAPHAGPIQRLTEILVRHLAGRAAVRVQLSLIAPDDSEPEPDLALVPPRDYDERHPSEATLVIEVADSSLAYGRGTKAPLYAAMGVPEYWIVNVRDAAIEVHREAIGDHYGRVSTHRKGDSISLVAFPDVVIAVADVVR
jgi:Uma2 family endonuclease